MLKYIKNQIEFNKEEFEKNKEEDEMLRILEKFKSLSRLIIEPTSKNQFRYYIENTCHSGFLNEEESQRKKIVFKSCKIVRFNQDSWNERNFIELFKKHYKLFYHIL